MKRLFDIVFSLFGLIGLSPFLLVVGMAMEAPLLQMIRRWLCMRRECVITEGILKPANTMGTDLHVY